MTTELKIADPQTLVQNLTGKLKDKNLKLDVLEAKVGAAPKLGIKDVSFGLTAGAKITLRSFNADGDDDPGHVVGQKAKENHPAPVLVPGPNDAFLKYELEATVGATGKAALSFAEIKAGVDKTVILADYRGHDPGDGVASAILADAAGGLRVPLRWNDIIELGPKDALSYQVRGKLEAGIEISWGDVFTAALPALTKLLSATTPIRLKTNLGATLGASINVTDDFLLVFSQPTAGRIHLGVRKAKGRNLSVGAKVGIDVGFEKPKELKEAVDGILADIAGEAIEQIDELLDRASLESLSPQERDLLEQVLERIGGAQILDGIERIKERWEALKASIDGVIEKAVNAKLEAGFRYDYSRIATDETLLEAEIDAGKLKGFHSDLLCCRLVDLTSFLRGASAADASVVSYLHETSLVKKSSWGFSLSLLGLTISGKDERKLEKKISERIDGTYAVAYKGSRSYSSELFENSGWIADFKADTTEYAKEHRAGDLYYGFHLQLSWSDKKPKERAIRAIVDEAIAWRVLDEDDEDALVEELLALSAGKTLGSRLDLQVNDLPTRSFVRRIAQSNEADAAFARALARALPWWEDSVARANVPLRETAYAAVWEHYLANPGTGARAMADFTVAHLSKVSTAKKAIPWERRVFKDARVGSVAWLVEKNTETEKDWRSFRKGCAKMVEGIEVGWPHSTAVDVHSQIQELWRQFHTMRAFGALLTDPSIGVPRDERTTSLTILVDGEPALVIGRS